MEFLLLVLLERGDIGSVTTPVERVNACLALYIYVCMHIIRLLC